jgi:hypothetical protein
MFETGTEDILLSSQLCIKARGRPLFTKIFVAQIPHL